MAFSFAVLLFSFRSPPDLIVHCRRYRCFECQAENLPTRQSQVFHFEQRWMCEMDLLIFNQRVGKMSEKQCQSYFAQNNSVKRKYRSVTAVDQRTTVKSLAAVISTFVSISVSSSKKTDTLSLLFSFLVGRRSSRQKETSESSRF